MKRFLFSALLSIAFGLTAQAQSSLYTSSKLASANQGEIQVTTLKVDYCGGVKYVLENTTKQILDVLYYCQQKNGQWSSSRATNNIGPGQTVTTADVCDTSGGRYVMYVRKSGSSDRFPNRPFN